MEPYINLLTAMASFGIVLRLCTFKHEGHQHKWGMALFAWFTVFISGAQGIHIIFFGGTVSISTLGITLILLYLVLRSKGNIACLTRIHQHELV